MKILLNLFAGLFLAQMTGMAQIQWTVCDSIDHYGYAPAKLEAGGSDKLEPSTMSMDQDGNVYIAASRFDEDKLIYKNEKGMLMPLLYNLPSKERVTEMLVDQKGRTMAAGLRSTFAFYGDNWISTVENEGRYMWDHVYMFNNLYATNDGRIMSVKKFKWQFIEGSESKARKFEDISYVSNEKGEIYAIDGDTHEFFFFSDKKWTSLGIVPIEKSLRLMLRADGVVMLYGNDSAWKGRAYEYVNNAWKEIAYPPAPESFLRLFMTNDGEPFVVTIRENKNYGIYHLVNGQCVFMGEVDASFDYTYFRFSSGGSMAAVKDNVLYIGKFAVK